MEYLRNKIHDLGSRSHVTIPKNLDGSVLFITDILKDPNQRGIPHLPPLYRQRAARPAPWEADPGVGGRCPGAATSDSGWGPSQGHRAELPS